MIALAILLAVALVGSIPLTAWLTYRVVNSVDKQADSRVAQVATEGEIERLQFEHEVTTKALAAANARAQALEGIISDEINDPPDTALSPGDVRGRLLRNAQAWRDSDANRVSAIPADPVPAEVGTAIGANPATVHDGDVL